jgi:hypothetical protein
LAINGQTWRPACAAIEIPFVLIAEPKITLEETRKAVGSFRFSPIIG